MMERIVHGDFASPDGTRDIIGITPDEFEVIIAALQNYHNALQSMYSTPKEARLAFFQEGFKQGLITGDTVTADSINAAIEDFELKGIAHYDSTYNILAQINQPYPGANYGGG